jgi:hypothetical protein
MGVEVELRITHPSHSLSQSIGCHGQLGTLKGRGSTDCESNVRIASKNDTVLILILGRAWWDKQTTLSHNPQPPSHYRMFDDWNREPRTPNPYPRSALPPFSGPIFRRPSPLHLYPGHLRAKSRHLKTLLQ